MDALIYGALIGLSIGATLRVFQHAAASRRYKTGLDALRRVHLAQHARLDGMQTAYRNAVAIADTLKRELNGRRCDRPRFVLHLQEIHDADFRTPAIYLETWGRSIEGAPVVVKVISTDREVLHRAMNAIACVRCEFPETSV